ncbi:MAG: SGNH/GDSL hydrolase family protein [Clostridia bacterium]|nr:SGNH/GDSL hydrolase family protein [Clostridia bacterium]
MTLKEKLQMDTNGLIAHGPVNIAFFGDSVTHGCFEDGVFDFDAVYHAKLARMLHRDYPTIPVNIINAGIGGITAQTSLPRLHRDVISHHPDLAVVCFGLNDVNDTVEEYTAALHQIFQALGEAGIPTVFLTPNMLNTYVDEPNTSPAFLDYARVTCAYQTSGKMDAFMEAARTCAAAHGVKVCDCYRLWQQMAAKGVDTTRLLVNRLNHPTREMHQLFADELYRMIREEL